MEGLLKNPQLVNMAKEIMRDHPGLVKKIKKSLRKKSGGAPGHKRPKRVRTRKKKGGGPSCGTSGKKRSYSGGRRKRDLTKRRGK